MNDACRRVHEEAQKINHFCAVLYRYLHDLREEIKDKEATIRSKEDDLSSQQREIDALKKAVSEAKLNLSETKDILNTKYKLDFEAMETEELL